MATTITQKLQQLSVALVYDHMAIRYGGAEVVLEALHELFPQAPILTTVANKNQFDWIEPKQIQTSFLQHVPGLKKHYRWTAPLAPLAMESLDLSQYELIISVTAGAAKGVLTHPGQLHLCYQLTPPRYLYEPPAGYLDTLPGFKSNITKWLMSPIMKYLRWWDQAAAHRPDATIAISELVANRIAKIYNLRVKSVIYPPFIFTNTSITDQHQDDTVASVNRVSNLLQNHFQNYLLVISRLVNYKRIDLVIAAAKLAQHPLIIVGEGVAKQSLGEQAGKSGYQRQAGQNLAQTLAAAATGQKSILFLNNVTDQEKQLLLKRAKALVMAGIEDFGIIGLEAAAAGTPVICHQQSGIAEVLHHQVHALHHTATTTKQLVAVFHQLENFKFSPQVLINQAQHYSKQKFLQNFTNTTYKLFSKRSTI